MGAQQDCQACGSIYLGSKSTIRPDVYKVSSGSVGFQSGHDSAKVSTGSGKLCTEGVDDHLIYI